MISSTNDKAMRVLSHGVLLLIAVLALVPFVLLVIASFTQNSVALTEGYSFFPSAYSTAAYEYLAQEWRTIGSGYLMTILVTVIGTTAGLLMTAMFAYSLSVPGLPLQRVLMMMVIISMLFNGGIVASYFIYSNVIHIKDTIFALIVPNLMMNAFNIILVKNYFSTNVVGELLEAARIDGAGEIKIFVRIVMPLAVPILATVGLLQAIGYWNDWTNGLYYLTKRNGAAYYTIQTILNQMNEDINFLASNSASMGLSVDTSDLPTTSMRMAIAVVAVLPILVAYPFFQKYFVKGIAVGAVKG